MQQANVMSLNPMNMASMVAMQGRPNTGMFTPVSMAMSQPATVCHMGISSLLTQASMSWTLLDKFMV